MAEMLQEAANTIEKLMQGEADERDAQACLDRLHAALRAHAGQGDIADDRCPLCWRKKAHSADDCAAGKCPKWYAVRDKAAADDCELFRKAFFAAAPAVREAQPDDAKPLI